MISVTRHYEFPAAHVLVHPDLDDEENRRIYGKCANPNGHGHNYGIDVTLTGPVDAQSGRIVELDLLDEIFANEILARFGHRTLNDDSAFSERVPTAENVARVIYEVLRPVISRRSTAQVIRIGVRETGKNTFAYGDAA